LSLDQIPKDLRNLYEVHEWKHASAVLATDFRREFAELIDVLRGFRLRRTDALAPGGGLSPISRALDTAFYGRGWVEKSFETKVVVDDAEMLSPTHKVDCFKNGVAVEIEWSNKDPFFDRDLNNFRLLFELRAISIGIIITKSDELRDVFEQLGIWKKYGTSTTWMSKLLPRVEGGGGGGCPLLVFGITKKLYVEE
jgi:hypothetical protein